jgi:hypothetical protein
LTVPLDLIGISSNGFVTFFTTAGAAGAATEAAV